MTILAPASATHAGTHADLIDLLRSQAQDRPDANAFSFEADGQIVAVLTYGQLDQRARAVAARLQAMRLAGERVLLAFPQGLGFIAGFFGCLYAGCTAVPTALPRRRTVDRFAAVAADAAARLVLSEARAISQNGAVAEPLDNPSAPATEIPWLDADSIPDSESQRWTAPSISSSTLAVLQYTSGSTSRPKGVMLSHANLIRNARDIHRAFRMGGDSAVFWLPVHHDMGLIGGVVAPVLAGAASALMAPASFLRQPFAWLEAISRRRATISGGPNFAYDLCARRITSRQLATLDLSSWSLAFVGAEPIQPDTLDRFAAAFGPCGFRRDAFYPCYGLAEATLLVSGAVRGRGPSVRGFDEAALAANRVSPAPADSRRSRRLVSCGTPVGDLRVAIVDPRSGAIAAPDGVGEIWVSGGSVAMGYWGRPGVSRRSFFAQPRGAPVGSFLRTGDLGFLLENQLFITGRQDDLLIVRGLNHHPQDIEATARRSHPLLEAGLGAAFALEGANAGELVLVQEVARSGAMDLAPVLQACREAVLAEHGLALQTIALVRCGAIPKTSSGKVQRRACREAFRARQLNYIARSDLAPDTASPSATPDAHAEPATLASQALAAVRQHALALAGGALTEVTPEAPLSALGLDSLHRVELAARLELAFACQLPDADFHPARTLGDLAESVRKHAGDPAETDGPPGDIPPAHYQVAHFPEYAELRRYERMLTAVAGSNPYFRVDQGIAPGINPEQGERDCVNFGVYDYLGLARDPTVAAAAKAAIDRYGASAGASRLVSGEKQVHRDLEKALAEFLGVDAALTFVSGHATNVTAIGHLFGPEDLIAYDALAHNSIIQGALLSGAARRTFAHNDPAALDSLLSEVRRRYRRVLIAIEGVYSMDGDFPDLPRFVALKKKHKALLLVDEAHSLGAMGRTGRGIGEHWGTPRTDVDLWMGTLSKALASCGGYIAGSSQLVEYLAYSAPGFVYSVGLSPPNAGAALAALTVLRSQPHRVDRLRELSTLFLALARQGGLDVGFACGAPVVPVIVGSSVKALRLSSALFNRGVNVQPIVHPAVPERSARLRFFITTNHSEAQIRDAVGAVIEELATLEGSAPPRRPVATRPLDPSALAAPRIWTSAP